MNAILKSVRDIEGVHGVLVVDDKGGLVAHDTIQLYDELVGSIGRAVVRVIESVNLLQENWEQLNTQFSEGKLLIRNLATAGSKATHGHTLTVIADSRLNPSFATIAIRVAIGKIRAVLESGAPIAASDRSGAVPMPIVGGSSSMRVAAVASSGLSWSGMSTSGASGSGVSVADPDSSHFLTACTKALARSAGPMAKLFVKEAVQRVSGGRPFSRELAANLIAEVAKGIDDPREAAAFRDAATRSL